MTGTLGKRSGILQGFMAKARELWGRPDPDDEKEALRRIGLLREREEAVSDCLLIVILGGTKVGKTTLINALAGKEIGTASAVACFTKRPAVFCHRNREMIARSRLSGVLETGDRFVVHDVPALERLILTDAPDLDGIDPANRKVFEALLERADLALCVVTTQKYDSLELFQVLGSLMGFRRTVFLFNRVDEGIPLSPKIREDLLDKVAPLGLRPPEGEELPVFAISAGNALRAKMGDPVGPRHEFPAFEEFLGKKLDQALATRINEENLASFSAETEAFVRRVSRVGEVVGFLRELTDLARSHSREAMERAVGRADSVMLRFEGEIRRRRESSAAEGLGGPFGVFVRVTLAVGTLSSRFRLMLPVGGDDLPEEVSRLLVEETDREMEYSRERFIRILADRADRGEFGIARLQTRLCEAVSSGEDVKTTISAKLRTFLFEPRSGRIESLLLNLLPLAIILLLARYFISCLMTAHDPSAGMFIGTGMFFWLVCHLQASFWLPRKAGAVDSALQDARNVLRSAFRDCLERPVEGWRDEVGKCLEILGDAIPTDGAGPSGKER